MTTPNPDMLVLKRSEQFRNCSAWSELQRREADVAYQGRDTYGGDHHVPTSNGGVHDSAIRQSARMSDRTPTSLAMSAHAQQPMDAREWIFEIKHDASQSIDDENSEDHWNHVHQKTNLARI